MSDGYTYMGSGKPVRNIDGALAVSHDMIALGQWQPVGAAVSDADLSSAYPVVFPPGSTGVLVQVFGKNIRVGFGSDVPTSSTGFQKTPEDGVFFIPASAGVVTLIEEEATATVYIQAVK